MYWKITRDLIAQGDWQPFTGKHVGTREKAEAAGLSIIPMRLLDDDRIVYYHCEVADDYESPESVLHFASGVGCTILQEKRNGEWVDVIS